MIPADRAFKILLTEEPNNFVAPVDKGKLVQNRSVDAGEAKSNWLEYFMSLISHEML